MKINKIILTNFANKFVENNINIKNVLLNSIINVFKSPKNLNEFIIKTKI